MVMILLAFLGNLAGPDLIIILLIVLVLFGAKKLPELAKGMGQAMKEFQKAKEDIVDEMHQADKPKPAQPPANTLPVARLEPGARSVVNESDYRPVESETRPPTSEV